MYGDYKKASDRLQSELRWYEYLALGLIPFAVLIIIGEILLKVIY